MNNLPEKEVKNLLKAATIVIIILGLVLFYYYLFPAAWNITRFIVPLIMPFIIALVMVGLLEPIVDFIERKLKFSRTATVLLVIFLFFALIIGIIIWLVYMLVVELAKFSAEFPKYASDISDTIINTAHNLEDAIVAFNIPPQIMEIIEEAIGKSLTTIRDISVYILETLIDFAALLPMGIIIFVFALLAVFFISRDKDILLKSLRDYLPTSIYKRLVLIGSEAGSAVFGFIRAQIILMFIVAGISFLGLQIINATYSLLVAVLIGILDLLPVVGPGALFVPWIIWEVVNGNFSFAVMLFILYTIISAIRQILQPKIVGDNIGLHPLETLIALFIGLRALGVLGLILGPIIWVIIKVSWKSGVFSRNFKV